MNFNKKFWTMTLSAAMAASLLAGCVERGFCLFAGGLRRREDPERIAGP